MINFLKRLLKAMAREIEPHFLPFVRLELIEYLK